MILKIQLSRMVASLLPFHDPPPCEAGEEVNLALPSTESARNPGPDPVIKYNLDVTTISAA